MERLKARMKKREYLIRMLALCILLLLAPIIVCLQLLVDRSYGRLLDNNRAHLISASEQISKRLEGEINRVYLHSASQSVSSRESGGTMSAFSVGVLTQSPFFYMDAIRAVQEINRDFPYAAGIYYQDRDWLFTAQSKMDAREYLLYQCGLHEDSAAYRDGFSFLKGETAEEPPAFSTFTLGEGKTVFLIAVPVRIGVERERAMMLYQMDTAHTLEETLLGASGIEDLQIVLFDGRQNCLYACGREYIPAEDFASVQSEAAVLNDFSYQGDRYAVIRTACAFPEGWSYITAVPFSMLSNDLYQFVATLNTITVTAMVCMVIFIILLVYFLYRPISLISRHMMGEEGENELETISGALRRIEGELSEHDMLLIDLLMTNILCSAPIPDKLRGRFDFISHNHCCVATIANTPICAEEQARLRQMALDRYRITLYITDMSQTNLMVFICLMKDDCFDAFAQDLSDTLQGTLRQSVVLNRGRVVGDIDDIHLSYEDCLSARSTSCDAPVQARDLHELKKDIRSYLQANYRDCELSQSGVADRFCISVYTLSRLFKNQVGIGFSEYITCMRLDHAKQALLLTSYAIAQIAEESGFSNANYFSRLFRSRFGVSPSEYRKRE